MKIEIQNITEDLRSGHLNNLYAVVDLYKKEHPKYTVIPASVIASIEAIIKGIAAIDNILEEKEKTLNTLSQFAMKAFKEGDDYFGEQVVTTKELERRTYDKSNPHWSMTVVLVEIHQGESRLCTSSVGFYMTEDKKQLRPCSGGFIEHWRIDITPEIQAELDAAPDYGL